jgi:hypothetical protein
MTRRPYEVLLLASADATVGGLLLWLALRHGPHRDVLVHFFAYLAVVLLFKGRDATRRVPQLVAAARTDAGSQTFAKPPLWLRTARLLLGYDTWSRTERFAVIVVSLVVCTLFGFDDGGPFAAALFLSIAGVDAALALVAVGARLLLRP